MKHVLAAAAAVAALSSAALPARASVIWQETLAPDPSGQTNVNIGVGFPMLAPATKALLTVHGGSLADIGWSELANYSIYVWWELPQYSGNWVLEGDNTYDLGVETIRTTPDTSWFRYDAGGYFTCYGSGFHSPSLCGEVFDNGVAGLDGALVNATRPFTLTLYTAVPEPSAWMMMIAGFGLLGLGLRGRRRHAAPPLD